MQRQLDADRAHCFFALQVLFRHLIVRPGIPEPITLGLGGASPPSCADDQASQERARGHTRPSLWFSARVPLCTCGRPTTPTYASAFDSQEGHFVYELGDNISSRCKWNQPRLTRALHDAFQRVAHISLLGLQIGSSKSLVKVRHAFNVFFTSTKAKHGPA